MNETCEQCGDELEAGELVIPLWEVTEVDAILGESHLESKQGGQVHLECVAEA